MLAVTTYDWFESALEECHPEDAEVQGLISRILLVARLDSVLLLFIVFDMAARPWS